MIAQASMFDQPAQPLEVFVPREFQSEAVDSAFDSWDCNNKHVGVIAPTGAGKTEIFVMVADRYLKENPTKKVVVLSHRDVLTGQTSKRFKKRIGIQPGILQGPSFPSYRDRIVVSTMQTMCKKGKLDVWKRRVEKFNSWNPIDMADDVEIGLVIVDEMHYLGCSSYNDILKMVPDALLFGVTATPFRQGHMMTGMLDDIAFTISMQELIDMGFLLPPKLHDMGWYDKENLDDVIATCLRIYKEKENGKSAIVFMRKMEDCTTCRTAFHNEGIEAACVTSKTGKDEREEIFLKYEKGEIKVLITVNVLTEGFDAPIASSVFMPYDTNSPTVYMQRVGRVLRPYEGEVDARVYYGGSDCPEISQKQWQDMQNEVLEAGSRKPKQESEMTYEEILEAMEKKETRVDEIAWNRQVVEAINKLKKLNSMELSNLMNEMAFPDRFLNNLDLFVGNMSQQTKPTGQITKMQVQALVGYGFSAESVKKMSKSEASAVIDAAFYSDAGLERER